MSAWLLRLMDTISNSSWFEFSLPPNQHVDFLGVMYAAPSKSEDPETAALVMEAFIEDFRSRIWITYRKNFPSLIDKDGTEVGITSDAGWGCSVRATQMLVAQSLRFRWFGRDSCLEKEKYCKILRHFVDHPSAALSIHKIVSLGHSRFGKSPSEWFGPTTSARAVELLINQKKSELGIAAVLFDGGEIYTSEVISLFENDHEAVLVMVSHRLGLDSFNLPRYKGTIQSLFSCPFFQGLSSGEAMVSAYYFFAACDDYLFYLDPHTVQEERDIENCAFPPQPKPLRMRWSRLNPSLTMGFVIKSPKEWDQLADYLSKIDPELFDINLKRREIRHSFSDINSESESDLVIID